MPLAPAMHFRQGCHARNPLFNLKLYKITCIMKTYNTNFVFECKSSLKGDRFLVSAVLQSNPSGAEGGLLSTDRTASGILILYSPKAATSICSRRRIFRRFRELLEHITVALMCTCTLRQRWMNMCRKNERNGRNLYELLQSKNKSQKNTSIERVFIRDNSSGQFVKRIRSHARLRPVSKSDTPRAAAPWRSRLDGNNTKAKPWIMNGWQTETRIWSKRWLIREKSGQSQQWANTCD